MPKPKANKKKVKGKPSAKPKSKQSKGLEKVGVAPAAVGVDESCAMSWKATGDGGIAEGREFLGTVVVPADDQAGQNTIDFFMSPGEFTGTRLALKAQEFQKFKFHEVEFEFAPAVGSDTPGSLLFAYNRDPSAPVPPASEQGVRNYLALEDSKFGNVWMPHKVKCPLRAQKELLWTTPAIGGDDRLAYQGQFFVSTMVPTGFSAAVVLGTIVVKYKCEFQVATLEDELEGLELQETTTFPAGDSQDYLAKFASPDVSTGDDTYRPTLQADNSWGITLREGLYRFLNFFGATTYSGAGTVAFGAPQLTLLDPASEAPGVVTPIAGTFGNGDASGGAPYFESYVAVPRGGGVLRQPISWGSTLATSAAQIGMSILRTSGYLPDVGSLLTLSYAKREKMVQLVKLLHEEALARGEVTRLVLCGPMSPTKTAACHSLSSLESKLRLALAAKEASGSLRSGCRGTTGEVPIPQSAAALTSAALAREKPAPTRGLQLMTNEERLAVKCRLCLRYGHVVNDCPDLPP